MQNSPYPKVLKLTHRAQADTGTFIAAIRKTARVVPGTTPTFLSPDPEDNSLFSCAIEAKADYIVSGDEHHVLFIPKYLGIRTIRPKDFVEQVLKARKAA